jgi:hypothetical protein
MRKKSETLTSCTAGRGVFVTVAGVVPMTIRAAIWARTACFVFVAGGQRGNVLLHHGRIVTDQSCGGRAERGKGVATRVVVRV